jgi:hypothetical protein
MRSDQEELLVVLAKINDFMMSIWKDADSNTAVAEATRGCDIRRYRDFMTEEEVECFEAYVEAKTHAGEIFIWSLDISLTSLGWKLQRCVASRTKDGEQQEKEFEDFTFDSFDELAKNYGTLMFEFSESAKGFDFRV